VLVASGYIKLKKLTIGVVPFNKYCICLQHGNHNKTDYGNNNNNNVIKKEAAKSLKYKDLVIEIQRMWNVKQR